MFSLVGVVSTTVGLIAILPIDDAFKYTGSTMLARIIGSLVAAFIYAWLARYFLTDGRRVHSWVDVRLPTELGS